jgi:hypothetical protein
MNNLIYSNSGIVIVLLSLCGTLGGARMAVSADIESHPLVTRWAKDVSAESVWPEYPRPQLIRSDWLNLNGEWQLAITEKREIPPTSFPDKILVPFPMESQLGGLGRTLSSSQRAWYQRKFEIDPSWKDQKLLLHFGAVDWHAEVWVNGVRAGEHRGGYDPFTFDITDLVKFGEDNVLVLGVSDPSDSGTQPLGKQRRVPKGIWYTPVSGIWQTVWLEPVPTSYVSGLKITPNYEDSTVTIVVNVEGATPNAVVTLKAKNRNMVVSSAQKPAGEPIVLKIADARPWSPSDPFLYDLEIEVVDDKGTSDQVTSYFGMRSIKLGPDRNGQIRMLLNGEPLFQFGPLDQGYWPDGLYTAPSDEALRYDLEVTKRLGFNMVRKHVKVEPARWYYWCDRLGLLVWQDMPNGGEHAPWPADGLEVQRSAESATQYRKELKAMVDALGNFPSIVVWVPFNEAWGQFDTESVTDWLQEYDPTRLIISASGGNDFGCGHINDDHFYPGPGGPPAERDRAAVLGEFGGLGLPVPGHTWQQEQNWGYRSFQTRAQLTSAYEDVIAKLRPLVESHLSAAVYTQTTDVEIEVNGLMTYDREIIKADESVIKSANAKLYAPLPLQDEGEQVAASVLTWWRFEEGISGTIVSDLSKRMGAIAARDFSGHNNHLFAFASDNAPSISDAVPRRSFGLVQAENRLCLNDTALPGKRAQTRDLYSNPEIAQTHMDKIDNFPFSNWTIEASFCLAKQSGEQVVLAKEKNLAGTMFPLFQLGVFGSTPTIGVELVDHANENIVIHSNVSPKSNEWWHVAITCDNGLVKFYIANDDPSKEYVLAGETRIKGSLALRGGTWLVGRGCDSGKMGRDFVGWIDEIRVSTKALEKSQFLFGSSL